MEKIRQSLEEGVSESNSIRRRQRTGLKAETIKKKLGLSGKGGNMRLTSKTSVSELGERGKGEEDGTQVSYSRLESREQGKFKKGPPIC